MKRLLFMLTCGGVFKNFICIALKRDMLYIFRQNVSIFNIVVYVHNIGQLNMQKNVQNNEIYYATRVKK